MDSVDDDEIPWFALEGDQWAQLLTDMELTMPDFPEKIKLFLLTDMKLTEVSK